MAEFLIRHRASIWMTLVQLILIALVMRPSFISFIMLGIIAGIMVLTREVATLEGRAHQHVFWAVAGGSAAVVVGIALLIVALRVMPSIMVVG
jgi:hypothetical protein